MKEKIVTDELWCRFLDGKTNEEETTRITQLMAENDELLTEYLSVFEAKHLMGAKPSKNPDLDLAREQVSQVLHEEPSEGDAVMKLPRRSNISKYFSMAAVLVVLVGVAVFFLFRPDHSDDNFAQKQVEQMDTQTSEPANEKMYAQTRNDVKSQEDREKDNPSEVQVTEEPGVSAIEEGEEHTVQMMEKQYAKSAQANRLDVTKPSKESYRVLCKNLEKTLDFEWSATNVQSLRFSVTDSKGKSIAESKDVAANHYSLKYSDIYPEQKLNWSLVVMFKDGLQEKRNGTIQIDYYHQK